MDHLSIQLLSMLAFGFSIVFIIPELIISGIKLVGRIFGRRFDI